MSPSTSIFSFIVNSPLMTELDGMLSEMQLGRNENYHPLSSQLLSYGLGTKATILKCL